MCLFMHFAECFSVELFFSLDDFHHLLGWQYENEASMIFLLQLLELDVYLVLSADSFGAGIIALGGELPPAAHLVKEHSHLLAHLSIHGKEAS